MNLANKITLLRIVLTPVFVALVLYSRFHLALVVFILAVVTDGLDGFVARMLKQKTDIGAILDPVADKLLIISSFLCLLFTKNIAPNQSLPMYIPIVVISRDVIIILGAVIINMLKGKIDIKPNKPGKITTFLQMMCIGSFLAGFGYIAMLWNIMVFFTVLSAVIYIMTGSEMLNASDKS